MVRSAEKIYRISPTGRGIRHRERCLIRVLSPSSRMTSLPGPMSAISPRSHDRATSAGSAMNSQPAQRASARRRQPYRVKEGDTARIIFHVMDADTHRRIGRRA